MSSRIGPASTKDFIIRNGEVDNHIFFMRSGKAGVYVTVEPPVWDSEAVRRPCARDQVVVKGMMWKAYGPIEPQ